MARKRIPIDTQTAVLVRSRRRCCICYGLHRDTKLKAGQIAHLDHDSSNATKSNLAFLCFEHHDEYDSQTRQRKGFTLSEVKRFRTELHEAISRVLAVEVHFGEVTIPKQDPVAGHYIRLGGGVDSAEIELTPIPDGLEGYPRYAVTGFALWGTNREYGPNMGELSFIGKLVDNTIWHSDYILAKDDPYRVRLNFRGRVLHVFEDNSGGVHGMNVSFDGEYRRA